MRVPIELIEWGLDRPNVLRTLLYLKKFSPGYIKEEDLSDWALKLDLHKKTLTRHLKVLEDKLWVNAHKGIVYLRSMKAIRRISGFSFRGRYYIGKTHFEDIQSWIFSRLVHRLSHFRGMRGKTRRIQKGVKSKILLAPLSVRYIAMCTGVSKSKVERLKKRAIESGAIVRESNGLSLSKKQAQTLLLANKFADSQNYVRFDGGFYLRRPDLLGKS